VEATSSKAKLNGQFKLKDNISFQ